MQASENSKNHKKWYVIHHHID